MSDFWGFVGTWVGVAASIIGAAIALWQARKSRNSAETAVAIAKHLKEHKEISEIAKLQQNCQNTIKGMEKYGSSSPESLLGVNKEKDAIDVQTFITILFEHTNYFYNKYETNQATETAKHLEDVLKKFVEETDIKKARPFGREILKTLNRFSAIIKNKIEKHDDNMAVLRTTQ